MIIISSIGSFISIDYTATADAAFRLTHISTPFYECNVHIYGNDVYYGTGAVSSAVAAVNSVLTFKNADLKDLFFKNKVAGNNGNVVIVASVPNKETLDALRL